MDVEIYFCQILASGIDGEELYEEVQYTPAFIPRLYLMILVGACCIRMKLIPAKKIIYDTLEMCKGIQHPMQGEARAGAQGAEGAGRRQSRVPLAAGRHRRGLLQHRSDASAV